MSPALLRHVVYSGIRISCYEQIKGAFANNPEEFTLWKKALAGAVSGIVGQMFASPTDLVKVRLQAQRRNMMLAQQQGSTVPQNITQYKGTIHAFQTIAKEEGIIGNRDWSLLIIKRLKDYGKELVLMCNVLRLLI